MSETIVEPTPLMVTLDASPMLVPVISTVLPGGPEAGEKPLIEGERWGSLGRLYGT